MNSDLPSSRHFSGNLFRVTLVIAVLYFARGFLIPVALSVLIAFLLGPMVTRLERMRLGRISAVIVVTLASFLVLSGLGYVVGGQLLDLAKELPKYRGTLLERVAAVRFPRDGTLARTRDMMQDLAKEFWKDEAAGSSAGLPASKSPGSGARTGAPGAKGAQAVPVSVVAMPAMNPEEHPISAPLGSLGSLVRPALEPLGQTTLVVVFVIFMLIGREDLRDRIIHLIGQGHLHITTQALDDAAQRVSRYLRAQLLVNLSYGIPIGAGLWLIGIPNSFLWGLLATVLRFIPYIGAWISAVAPLTLSLAVSSGWATPLLTLGLFIVVEIMAGYVFEPWLYGSSTGLSPMAVIIAAAFWTWLWGSLGLLLATPLTVCLAVLGKYIPRLSYLDVLLGDQPPIAPEDRFYQRLLASDEDEAMTIAENYTRGHSLEETFENLIVPAIALVDNDFREGVLSQESRARVHQMVQELISEVGSETPSGPPKGRSPAVVCLFGSTLGEELIAAMLARTLAAQGIVAEVIPSRLLASETLAQAIASPSHLFCISVLTAGTSRHGLYAAKRLREQLPEARILVGLWGTSSSDHAARIQRFRQVPVDCVLTSLSAMAREIGATELGPLPIRAAACAP